MTLAGGGTTTTNLSGTTLTISSESSIQTETDPKLTATLNAQTNNIINVGNMTGLVHGLDIRNFDGVQQYLTLEMGEAVPTVFTSTLEYLAQNLVIDYDDGSSSFTASTAVEADMGTL